MPWATRFECGNRLVYRAIWFSLAIVARVMSRAGFHETVAPLLDRPLGEDHLVEGGQRRDVGVD
jgi:hypothetical protein